MRTALECIPCFARQALEAARFVTDDPEIHERLLRGVLRASAEMDFCECPPVVARQIHGALRQMTGVVDPYRAVKDRFQRMALDMTDELSGWIEESDDPLALALRLSIAGNVIDFGVHAGITEDEARLAIRNTLDEPFVGDIDAFRLAVDAAESVLYLADNAGEIVFDRLLIEQLPKDRVTVAVRGAPVLNDATMEDAGTAGLCRIVEVIDNGSDAPGTVLSDCSESFLERFRRADLVIAKGQGNFETLSDQPGRILFLLEVKCPVIARHIGSPMGTHVLASTGAEPIVTDNGDGNSPDPIHGLKE